MKTAVIYARYSSDAQSEQSIEGQLRVCEDYAKRNNITILNTYVDRAMTGTNDNRPDFQQMIKDSSKREWEYVIVYKIDRFSRNKYENAKYKKILKDNGVKVLSAMENIPDTPEGIILESLLEGMAEYYSAELAQKVKRGMRETRLKGLYQGGPIPYGYKIDGRKIVIDETKADIVRYIYRQYANGYFVRQIVEDLTSKGILSNGKPFSPDTLYTFLCNEKYVGVYRKNGEVFTDMYPQIVDSETFDKVKAKRKINHHGKVSLRATYLLKGKLICGYCGKTISAECGTTKQGKTLMYYKCIGRKKYHNDCPKDTVRKEVLEAFILNAIVNELSKSKNMDILIKKLTSIQNDNSNSVNLNLLLKSKKQAEITLNNLLQAVEKGIINKTTNARMEELEKQIEGLEKQILVERSKNNTILPEEQIRKYYCEALKQQPIVLINILVKQIKLYNDKVEITFNNPLLKSPDNQGFSFFSKTLKMGKVIQNNQNPKFVELTVYYLF